MSADPAEHHDDPLIGSLLGHRYRVERILGEGGAGIVYDALHEELGRPVAIKVLGAAWAYDPEATERFQREARASSGIGHRHIVDVYDLGKLDDGRPYLVMERLHGEPLDSVVLRDARLPPSRVAELMEQAASALDAVHRKGIVHRDIKPENLFLATNEDSPRPIVKLLDFGLAAFHQPGAAQARLTRQGMVHGTPHYMAPEATADELPDHRADVYSLGVVAFELIAGVLPFDSPNPISILTMKHSHDAPSLVEATGESYPEALEAVFAKVLARDPEMRYQSAGAFARALLDACDSPTIDDARPRAEGPAEKEPEAVRSGERRIETVVTGTPLRRGPLWALAGALLGLLLVGGGALWASRGTGQEEDEAQDEAQASEGSDEDGRDVAAADSADPVGTPTAPEDLPDDGDPAEEPPVAQAGEGSEAESLEETPAEEGSTAVEHRARGDRPLRRPTGGARGSQPAGATEENPGRSPELAETNQARAQILSREGTQAMLQGRLPDAIRLFRDATIAYPYHAPSWRGLGLANERIGRRPEAARAYARYLSLAPEAADAAEVRRRLEALD